MIGRIRELAKKECIEFTHHARTQMTKQCPVCGGQLKKDNIMEEVWVEGKLLVIDNLPAKVCVHCGESIVDYSTMKKIENIIEKFKHKEILGTKFTAYEIDAKAAALA